MSKHCLLLIYDLFNYLFLLVCKARLLWLLHDRPLLSNVSPVLKLLNVHHVDIFEAITILHTGTYFHRYFHGLNLRLTVNRWSVQWARRGSQFFLDSLLHFLQVLLHLLDLCSRNSPVLCVCRHLCWHVMLVCSSHLGQSRRFYCLSTLFFLLLLYTLPLPCHLFVVETIEW